MSLAVAAIAAATVGALYRQHEHRSAVPSTIADVPNIPTPEPNATFTEALPSPDASQSIAPMIFRVITDDNGSHLKMLRMKSSDAVGLPGVAPAITALNTMAALTDSPLPTGTKALSYVASGDGQTATVDFNDAFVKNFVGGDTGEALAIESILATVGQFGPRSVQITVEGKKVDSLGGNQSLMAPLPVPQAAGEEQTALKGGATP